MLPLIHPKNSCYIQLFFKFFKNYSNADNSTYISVIITLKKICPHKERTSHIFTRFRRSEFSTTEIELNAIAAPASQGTKIPNIANGIKVIFYKNAHTKFCFILSIVFYLSPIASTNLFKSPLIIVTSPNSIATSDPVPKATPT